MVFDIAEIGDRAGERSDCRGVQGPVEGGGIGLEVRVEGVSGRIGDGGWGGLHTGRVGVPRLGCTIGDWCSGVGQRGRFGDWDSGCGWEGVGYWCWLGNGNWCSDGFCHWNCGWSREAVCDWGWLGDGDWCSDGLGDRHGSWFREGVGDGVGLCDGGGVGLCHRDGSGDGEGVRDGLGFRDGGVGFGHWDGGRCRESVGNRLGLGHGGGGVGFGHWDGSRCWESVGNWLSLGSSDDCRGLGDWHCCWLGEGIRDGLGNALDIWHCLVGWEDMGLSLDGDGVRDGLGDGDGSCDWEDGSLDSHLLGPVCDGFFGYRDGHVRFGARDSGLHDDRFRLVEGGIGRVFGLDSRLVGLNVDLKAVVVGDVVDDSDAAVGVLQAVGPGDIPVGVSSFSSEGAP